MHKMEQEMCTLVAHVIPSCWSRTATGTKVLLQGVCNHQGSIRSSYLTEHRWQEHPQDLHRRLDLRRPMASFNAKTQDDRHSEDITALASTFSQQHFTHQAIVSLEMPSAYHHSWQVHMYDHVCTCGILFLLVPKVSKMTFAMAPLRNLHQHLQLGWLPWDVAT